MNPLGLMFLDGTALFAGLAVVLAAGAMFVRSGTGLLRPISTVLLLAGFAAVLLSAVPLPSWLYALWILPAGAVLVLGNLPGAAPVLRFRAFAVLLAASAAILLVELPHLRAPRIRLAADQSVYVVGDSISAGIGSGERCWPEVLAASTSLRVVNLAVPGATTQSALAQLPRIAESNAVVLLEIGGNDLLDRIDADTFEDGNYTGWTRAAGCANWPHRTATCQRRSTGSSSTSSARFPRMTRRTASCRAAAP